MEMGLPRVAHIEGGFTAWKAAGAPVEERAKKGSGVPASTSGLKFANFIAGDRDRVSHGAVGTLLYCHLAGQPIERRWDQPANGGGNWFGFSLERRAASGWWKPFDETPSEAPAWYPMAR